MAWEETVLLHWLYSLLCHKLCALHLKEGESVQEHTKAMTGSVWFLAVVGDPVSEENRVVHLLASFPDSFDMLVTALETNETVPKMETVTEHLLHKEQKNETPPCKFRLLKFHCMTLHY